ncbi:MAG: hypothetical protein JXN61_11045 [Sedimentisphaerales bacterium]|nr:hypothetical protein [Sedimentisphaerales bacterium]
MNGQRKCEGCRQRHDCGEVYGKLEGADGTSLALSVVVAFLSPIVIFVVFLAAVERAAGLLTARVEVRTALGLVSAVAATLLWVLVAERINRRMCKKSGSQT